MTSIGSMRHRMTLQTPDTTEPTGFRDVATVWAALETAPASGDPMRAGGPSAVALQRVRMHFRDDVRSGWRVVDSARVFEVAGYGDPDGQRRELLLVCAAIQ